MLYLTLSAVTDNNCLIGFVFVLSSVFLQSYQKLIHTRTSSPCTNAHLCITTGSGANDGLVYYQNGIKTGTGTKIAGTYSSDSVTKMTLGKPNRGEQFFGSFKINNLVVWYKTLTPEQITTVITGMLEFISHEMN